MYLILLKTAAAISIFLLSLIAGFYSIKITRNEAFFLRVGDAFASGVFLSAAFLHLLPEASIGFHHFLKYPFASLICLLVFVILLIMRSQGNKTIAPFFLIFLLAIHSLIEGAAIGASQEIVEASILFFAVIAHKGSESFALALKLRSYNLQIKYMQQIIAVFSFLTPLGVFLASLVINTLQTKSGNTLGSTFNAIAAGTFLYLGTEYLIEEKNIFKNFVEIIALLLGITLMAFVAIWT